MNWESYRGLSYQHFRVRAKDPNLSSYEKIGFPRAYREGKERVILEDILSKLSGLRGRGKSVLDIGAGCSPLASLLVDHCLTRAHRLILMDSEEMLNQLPLFAQQPEDAVQKIAGYFPVKPESFVEEFQGKLDVVLCYSVLHGTFLEMDPFHFLDAAVSLLSPGGELLIGDIPNASKRSRFFASEEGVRFHQQFMKTTEAPGADMSSVAQTARIDDAVIFSILQRYRNLGMEAYVLPQSPELPMANRREDVLIRRP